MHPSPYIILASTTVHRYYGVSSAPNAFVSVLLEEEKTSERSNPTYGRKRARRSDVAYHSTMLQTKMHSCGVFLQSKRYLAAQIVKAIDGRRHRP
jgi:hypothetical protein